MVLKVHNLFLPLKETTTGPLLSLENKFLEPLEWVVNSALMADIQQITKALADGEDVFIHQQFYAVRPTPADDDLEKLRARWHELTSEDSGKDVYILGTGFTTHRVVLPRQTLLLIIHQLLKLRAEFPELPFPWLFRADPYHLTPTDGEEELMRKLEERAVRAKTSQMAFNDSFTELIRDLQKTGLFSDIYSEEKQYWLELWGLTTLLDYHRAALTFLNHFRERHPVVTDYVTASRSPKETNGSTPSFALEASIKMRSLA